MSSAPNQPAPADHATYVARIAELEAQLARERAESARRLREVEPRFVQFRDAIHLLRQDLRQAAADRARSAELLDRAAAESDALRLEAEAARASVARLEGEMARARADAADRAAALTARIDELQREPAAARANPAGADGARAFATDGDGHFPQVAGLRCEGPADPTPFGVRFHARRTSDRLPVDVLVVSDPAAAARLDSLPLARHPNLVSALASGMSGASAYVVLERPTGETLERAVGRDGPMDELKALRIARQVAQGLRHAAVHGLLHGDLSPRAVRLGADDDAQVADVGLGPALPPAERPPADARFASPERLAGADAPDARADVYSLGAVLAFLLTGAPPYEGDRDGVLRAQAAGPAHGVRKRRRSVTAETEALVASLVARDPAQRPQDWDAALGAIESAVARLAGEPAAAPWLDRLTAAIAARPAVACALAVAPVVAAALALHLAANDTPASQRAPVPSVHAAPARER